MPWDLRPLCWQPATLEHWGSGVASRSLLMLCGDAQHAGLGSDGCAPLAFNTSGFQPHKPAARPCNTLTHDQPKCASWSRHICVTDHDGSHPKCNQSNLLLNLAADGGNKQKLALRPSRVHTPGQPLPTCSPNLAPVYLAS